MRQIRNLIKGIVQLGIEESFSTSERSTLILLNIISSTAVLVSIIYTIVGLVYNAGYLYFDLLCIVIFSIPLLFNRFGKQEYAKLSLIIALLIAVNAGSYVTGYERNFKILLFIPISLSFIFYSKKLAKKLFIVISLILASFVGIEYYHYQKLDPIQNGIALEYFYNLALFFVVLTGFIITQILFIKKVKNAEDELLLHQQTIMKQNEELKSLNTSKDKFFSILAHDLKSPFQGLVGLSEILVDHAATAQDNKTKFIAENIHKAAVQSYDLTDNLLIWARAQSGKIAYNPRPFKIQSLVASTLKLVHHSVQKKGIEIISDIHEDIELFADPDMIGLVIRNLLTNAIKFTPEKGQIEICCSMSEDKVKLSVKDTGTGMSNEQVDNLFNLAKSYTTKGTNGESGTGLGLHICKEFIDMHKGEFWVESETDKGSTFSFTLATP